MKSKRYASYLRKQPLQESTEEVLEISEKTRASSDTSPLSCRPWPEVEGRRQEKENRGGGWGSKTGQEGEGTKELAEKERIWPVTQPCGA